MTNELNSFGIPDWQHAGKGVAKLEDFPEDIIGFIYRIDLSNGKSYIGRKSLFSKRKRNFGKKELALITDKRVKKYEIIKKESDWNSYIGSNKFLHKDVSEGIRIESRYILKLCKTEKELTYYETSMLFGNDVLFGDRYYNDNILGKFFRKDLLNG